MSASTIQAGERHAGGTAAVLDPFDPILDDRLQPAVVSARKPYRTTPGRMWFMRTREYRAYAVREFSSVVVGFFALDLMVGLVSIQRGQASWEWWVTLQTRPLNVVLTAIAIVMSLVHATTWFQATPKIIKIRRGTHYVADGWVVAAQYVLLVAFGVVVCLWLGGL